MPYDAKASSPIAYAATVPAVSNKFNRSKRVKFFGVLKAGCFELSRVSDPSLSRFDNLYISTEK